MVRNVVIPMLTMFAPTASNRNGTAVIVAPGGAFHFLMMNHEGDDVARWFADGGHGFGANTLGRRSDSWRDLFRDGLVARGYLPLSSK